MVVILKPIMSYIISLYFCVRSLEKAIEILVYSISLLLHLLLEVYIYENEVFGLLFGFITFI